MSHTLCMIMCFVLMSSFWSAEFSFELLTYSSWFFHVLLSVSEAQASCCWRVMFSSLKRRFISSHGFVFPGLRDEFFEVYSGSSYRKEVDLSCHTRLRSERAKEAHLAVTDGGSWEIHTGWDVPNCHCKRSLHVVASQIRNVEHSSASMLLALSIQVLISCAPSPKLWHRQQIYFRISTLHLQRSKKNRIVFMCSKNVTKSKLRPGVGMATDWKNKQR